jgi:hypothetical protein
MVFPPLLKNYCCTGGTLWHLPNFYNIS